MFARTCHLKLQASTFCRKWGGQQLFARHIIFKAQDVSSIVFNNLHSETYQISSVSRRATVSSMNGQRYFSCSASRERNVSCAIVGTGPSGFYTAKYMLAAFEKMEGESCTVDLIERLPTPFGLVRYGVAPDHPDVKNVENDFSALFDMYKGHLNFIGNVHVGDTNCVTVQELRELYDVVVLAYGCESDRKLGIPGEDRLSGILTAREFVAWYNGHPHFEHIGERVATALRSDGNREVVIIGQGNVALDCARILAKGGKGLDDTDISSRALSVIGEEGVPVVTIVGRRGHVQGAFTIKELRELTKLEDVCGAKFIVREDELELGLTPASQEELSAKAARPKVRMDKLLWEAAAQATEDGSNHAKEVHLRFLMSPKEFKSSESDEKAVGSVVCERTKLEGEAGKQVAVGTEELETFPAQLVLVSIGYKGIALPGTERWFDEKRGAMKNHGGKVDDATSSVGGLYVSGWIKRGPSGIIGTNIMDAKDTVYNIMKDLETKNDRYVKGTASTAGLYDLLQERGVPTVKWSDYQKIVIAETDPKRKRNEKQPREKLTEMKELLEAACAS